MDSLGLSKTFPDARIASCLPGHTGMDHCPAKRNPGEYDYPENAPEQGRTA
jgi:hypothetical protein